MPPFLINFLLAFKKEIIIALVVIGAVVGLYLYHTAAVFEAEQAMKFQRDTYWVNYIKSAPKETVEVKIQLPAPPPKIVTVRDTTVDSTALQLAQDNLDSLAKENESLAAFLAMFRKTFTGTFTDTLGWAQHIITADPWKRTITDSIHYNPASITGIQVNSLVPIPYNKFGISAVGNTVGQVNLGFEYRITDPITIGAEYQAIGPVFNTKVYERARLRVVWHFN